MCGAPCPTHCCYGSLILGMMDQSRSVGSWYCPLSWAKAVACDKGSQDWFTACLSCFGCDVASQTYMVRMDSCMSILTVRVLESPRLVSLIGVRDGCTRFVCLADHSHPLVVANGPGIGSSIVTVGQRSSNMACSMFLPTHSAWLAENGFGLQSLNRKMQCHSRYPRPR